MKRIVCGAFALLLLTLVSSEAYSCGCAEITQRQEFDNSRAVFVGKYVGTSRKDGKAKFKVIRTWKGARKGTVLSVVYWELEGCDYDLNLSKDKTYLIYAVPDHQGMRISVECGRSRSIKDAKDDLRNMNKVASDKSVTVPSP